MAEEQLEDTEGDKTPPDGKKHRPEEPEYDIETDLITDSGEADPVVLLMATLREHYQALAKKSFYSILGRIRGQLRIDRLRDQIMIAHYRKQFPILAEHARLEMAIYGMEDGAAEDSLMSIAKVIGGASDEKERRWPLRRKKR